MMQKTCPKCSKLQIFKHSVSFQRALKINSICRQCSQAEAVLLRPQCTKGFTNLKSRGANNAMFGKSFVDVWNAKYDEETVNQLKADHARKSSHYGEANGMFGKSFYDQWVKKYGKERADQLMAERKSKMPVRKGELNPQFGKPAPLKAGRGIKGWLDGTFFRSLLEMQYIYYRINNQDNIKGAETLNYRVNYVDKDGKSRTYHPDFCINDQLIVEVKPSNLIHLHQVKIDAGARKFGSNYLIETEKTFDILVDCDLAKCLVESGRLKFMSADVTSIYSKIKIYYRRYLKA
jgi:hypothetical protein